ncbi:uncharacterized protein LOC108163872 [Drosophila miranda]|uniref:uncharacterized protein LOC108163872 n=1 Tax=Drosophila miranda TaxID=7229 RepID=UPI00143F6F81|nr:uncharacterized protein LOC108163872 [Drosophila miranda]
MQKKKYLFEAGTRVSSFFHSRIYVLVILHQLVALGHSGGGSKASEGRPCAPPASEDRTAINSVLRATISNAKEAPSPKLLSISPPTHGPRATRRRRRGSDADGRTLIYTLQMKETKDLDVDMS